MELSALERLKSTPIDIKWGKWYLHCFFVVFDPIVLILAGNENMHLSLDEFEFQPDLNTDY